MSFWKRFTGVVLLLVAGFLAGATVSSSLDWNPAAAARRHWRHGPSPLSGSFYEELNLNSDQQAAVEEVLERSRSGLADLRETMAPRIHEMVAKAVQDIEPLLEPEQKTRYQNLLAGWEERHRRVLENQRKQLRSRTEANTDAGDR